jgi:hypothetical protein
MKILSITEELVVNSRIYFCADVSGVFRSCGHILKVGLDSNPRFRFGLPSDRNLYYGVRQSTLNPASNPGTLHPERE